MSNNTSDSSGTGIVLTDELISRIYHSDPLPSPRVLPRGCGCMMVPIILVFTVMFGYILLSLALKGLFN